jgi:hypothetical protein
MVKSFKADLRQGGNTILDDVYARQNLYVNSIIMQDSEDSNISYKLTIKNGAISLERIDNP